MTRSVSSPIVRKEALVVVELGVGLTLEGEEGVTGGIGGAIPPSLPVVPRLVGPEGKPDPSLGVATMGFV